MSHAPGTRAGLLADLNAASLAARPWRQPGYAYRPGTVHDRTIHDFRAQRPYYGWTEVKVGELDLTMYSNNDDGVACVYHTLGPDSYEAVSIAVWSAIAAECAAVIDVGAFTGLYAMLAQKASPGANVLAVEPNSAARARLVMNLVANGMFPQVRVSADAIAAERGVLSLHVHWGADILDTGSSLMDQAHLGPHRGELVHAAPLDALLGDAGFAPVELAKIDVEGLEEVVLDGARHMLANSPTLILEIRDARAFRPCQAVLGPRYRIFMIDDDRAEMREYLGEPLDAWFAQHMGDRILNFLCVVRPSHLEAAERGFARIRALLGGSAETLTAHSLAHLRGEHSR